MRTLLALAVIAAVAHGSGSPGPPAALLAGRQHGIVEERYAGGQLKSRGQFWFGEKAGRYQTWWANGHLRSDATYDHDVFNGEYRTWYSSGKPYELRHFDHGRESGVEQSWNEDRSLFLNYEVRNGRRYGLINATPCLPADKDGYSRRVSS